MSWLDKIKQALARFFQGRRGIDQLGVATMLIGLILSFLDGIFSTGVLTLLGMAAYIVTIYRMLSRDLNRRSQENLRFTTWWYKTKTSATQAFTRLKNVRKYKYFRCPGCKAYLRLPRGAGSGTITCSKCGRSFHAKA